MKSSVIALACSFACSIGLPVCAETVLHPVTQSRTGTVLRWQTDFPQAAATLRITGPNETLEQKFGAEAVQYAVNPAVMAEGSYVYELTFLSALPATGSSRDKPSAAPQAARVTGNFRILGGVLYTSDTTAEQTTVKATAKPTSANTRDSRVGALDAPVAPLGVVVADDQIVIGSLCVGFNCVNGEPFGFDTIRMKEDNTRIKFEDTSSLSDLKILSKKPLIATEYIVLKL